MRAAGPEAGAVGRNRNRSGSGTRPTCLGHTLVGISKRPYIMRSCAWAGADSLAAVHGFE
jgi:hypothetical protein